jgi:tetratricopeptide (TPR) repeat protein
VHAAYPQVAVKHASSRLWVEIMAAVVVLIGGLLAVPQIRHAILPAKAGEKSASGKPVTVLVADFTNHTGDPLLDGTLEPMVNVALERASFINAFNRGTARKRAQKLPNPTDKLDEQPARLVAVSEGVGAVVTGEISRRSEGYRVSLEALDARSGVTLGSTEMTVADKNHLLEAVPKLVAPIRKALGDNTPESAQLADAGGAFTAAALEAVHQYGVAMEQQFAGNIEGALSAFSKAAEMDPNFARAYAGIAGMSANLGKQQDADKYIRLAMEHVDRMTDRERYRIRGLYYGSTGNWQKCIEEYGELVNRYPADNIGHNNLANCYSHIRNLPKAVEEARRALEINPNSVTWRANLALFSNYASDSQAGEQQARQLQKINPAFEYGYLSLAFAQLLQGQSAQAAETYQQLERLSPLGASLAASGFADLSAYEGRFADAVRILEKGAAADLEAKNTDAAADKFATLAWVRAILQHSSAGVADAERALARSQAVKIKFLAARVFLEAGEAGKAQKLASALGSELDSEPQAYAKIIAANLALKRGDAREAVKLLTEANNALDTWIGRFELGRAYVAAGAFAEADSEFDRCLKRRGEALALFLDEVPTYFYFPPVYYYQGRVREGLKSPGSAESYRNYLNIRGKSQEDPLLADVTRRLGQ